MATCESTAAPTAPGRPGSRPGTVSTAADGVRPPRGLVDGVRLVEESESLDGTAAARSRPPPADDRPAHRRLDERLGAGPIGGRRSRPAAALPTVATGLAEYRHADPVSRRVGVVHADADAAGVALYAASLATRRRGHRARGVALARQAASVAARIPA